MILKKGSREADTIEFVPSGTLLMEKEGGQSRMESSVDRMPAGELHF